jgi:hypothetical protein
VFTARYGLIAYIKQIMFSVYRFKMEIKIYNKNKKVGYLNVIYFKFSLYILHMHVAKTRVRLQVETVTSTDTV